MTILSRHLLLFIAALFLIHGSGKSDEIILKNGETIYGVVKRYHAGVGFLIELQKGDSAFYNDEVFSIKITEYETRRNQYLENSSRSKDSIAKVVIMHTGELAAEYEKTYKKAKYANKKILVKMTISPSGNVIKSEVLDSEFKDKRFENNVLSIINKWKFNKIVEKDTMDILYPFIF